MLAGYLGTIRVFTAAAICHLVNGSLRVRNAAGITALKKAVFVLYIQILAVFILVFNSPVVVFCENRRKRRCIETGLCNIQRKVGLCHSHVFRKGTRGRPGSANQLQRISHAVKGPYFAVACAAVISGQVVSVSFFSVKGFRTV